MTDVVLVALALPLQTACVVVLDADLLFHGGGGMTKRNALKVSLGLPVGFLLQFGLGSVLGLPWYIIALVSWGTFIAFYSGIDKIRGDT